MRASYILSGIFNENTKTFNIFYFDNKKDSLYFKLSRSVLLNFTFLSRSGD